MTAIEILNQAEAHGADCCAIYNRLLDEGYDDEAEVFAGLDGRPDRSEMDRAYRVALESERIANAEASFNERHDL